jgi:hypothetical protein
MRLEMTKPRSGERIVGLSAIFRRSAARFFSQSIPRLAPWATIYRHSVAENSGQIWKCPRRFRHYSQNLDSAVRDIRFDCMFKIGLNGQGWRKI